ncbi:hypothetical protein KVR01_002319 [Diaporthe batatas]|uniref:uncharacterized protein n=1 Tax=Diaporthe batatas TaxID=748121 RepID=UPI001D039271|nr:uncharacterized protein KVR01_002319 [Diaporthe batatas]KAG8166630.1 hypothetical protein KVR01_002319 [Diaporthe batatas]
MTRGDRASLKSTNGTEVGLEKITRRHFRQWGIVEYRVYRAEPECPFEEVDLAEDEDSPLCQGSQTLIVCESPTGQSSDSRSTQDLDQPHEPLNTFADVRWYLRKNEECEPLQFEGHRHNPWRHDDIIFHLPYFQFNESKRVHYRDAQSTDEFEVEKEWYFEYERTAAEPSTSSQRLSIFMNIVRGLVSSKHPKKGGVDEERGAPEQRTLSNPTSLYFDSRAFTICMLPFLDGKQADKTEGPEQKGRTNCRSWVALVVAPGDIIWDRQDGEKKLLDEKLLDGNLASRAPANRKSHNRRRFGMERFKSPRDADYFQTCLIEVGMKKIAEIWNNNADKATKACHSLERNIHGNIHGSPNSRSDYWRRGVNDDLLSIYKLQKRLESLEANLFNNLTSHEQGVWSNFRKARPGQRLEQLEKEEEDGKEERKKKKRKVKAQKSSEAENENDYKNGPDEKDALERERLRFLLHGCLDRHWDRLCGQSKKLRQKIDDLKALRELLVELSQTRASLYANDLGDNVMYLTYISILFLPLSFCTSLWAMNHELPYYAFVPTICVTSGATAVLLAVIRFRMSYQ